MSLFDELELRAGFEARAALGARALVPWAVERLVVAPRSVLRAELACAALVAALELEDDEAARTLLLVVTDGPKVDLDRALGACESCGRASLALEVAEQLVALDARPVALLALGAIAERAGHDERAAHAYGRAREAARAEGDTRAADAARVELARTLLRRGEAARVLEALADVEDAASLDLRARLVVAQGWLAASGRYRRCAAIDLLADVALQTTPDAPEARAALRLVGRHLDTVGRATTAAEVERIAALVGKLRSRGDTSGVLDAIERVLALLGADAAAREAMIVREALASETGRWLLERARGVRDGGTPGPRPPDRTRIGGWLSLAALTHLRARRLGEARAALRELASHLDAPNAAGWTVLRAASRERALTTIVVELAERWLNDASCSPPRGFVDLAAALERAGLEALAGRALGLARARHEPDARAIAIRHGIRRAWAEYDRGHLREARALLLAALDDANAGSGSRKP